MTANQRSDPTHPLWVFIDESGNFDFAVSGTPYFLMTAVMTTEPSASGARMLALKYEQMLRGSNQLDFHASHNSHGTRKRVLEQISRLESIRSKTFAFDKTSLLPGQRSSRSVLERLATAIAHMCVDVATDGHNHVTIVFDTAFPGGQAEFLKHHIKTVFSGAQFSYGILFHRVAHEPNGQIADYIAWAHARSFTRGDNEGLKHLNPDSHTIEWLNE